MAEPIISVHDLSIGFNGQNGTTLPILRNIDISVNAGETIGLVGESGSGKSTLALAMMGYLKSGLRVIGGETRFRGRDTFSLSTRELETIRGGDLALIPQNAGQSLTPTLRIGAQIEEALRLHSKLTAKDRDARVIELLSQVRLPDPSHLVARFPHELSGGQQQRVAIAMALAGEPNALLLDEPTTGLDVTTQAHVLELLRDLSRATGTAMVYVSHDLGAIARVCDRVAVMYAGEIVLEGASRNVLRAPIHPYAKGLIASIPRLASPTLPLAMEGRPPQPGGAGDGCAFSSRCPYTQDLCRRERPLPNQVGPDQFVRCHFHDRVANDRAAQIGRTPRARNFSELNHKSPIISLDGLSISYTRQGLADRLLGRKTRAAPTVDDVSLVIEKGETIGLVGESGSGKSTILKAIAGLLPHRAGTITFAGSVPLEDSVTRRTPHLLRQVQLIFQNPDESLNPRHTIGEILAQPLRLYFDIDRTEMHRRSVALLERVRLGAHYLDRLPSQLSGGEKQRVAIARAFAAEPQIILCDEVTSALDVSVQAAVLDLLDELRALESVTYIFVSHDLAVVRALADRVVVLYQGRICEVGPAASVYAQPAHPYTEVLLGAVLEPDPDQTIRLLGEDVVELSPPARGCPFQRRCHRKIGEICSTTTPPNQDAGGGHFIRCHIDINDLARQQAQELQTNRSTEPKIDVVK